MFFLHFEVTTLTLPSLVLFFFFFNDTATTEIYTLSLHDALPIFVAATGVLGMIVFDLALGRTRVPTIARDLVQAGVFGGDRKSTRLNSSHQIISYAVFCLKKKIKFF